MSRYCKRRIDSADVTQNAVNTHVMGSLRVGTGHLGTSTAKFFLNLVAGTEGKRKACTVRRGLNEAWNEPGSRRTGIGYEAAADRG